MISAVDLDVLWVVGSNPLEFAKREWRKTFIVVQEMFMTETAQLANVVLPAASAYEKNGTVTNVCGEVQRLKQALNTMGTKSDLEIMGLDRPRDRGWRNCWVRGSRNKCLKRSALTFTATMWPLPIICYRRSGAGSFPSERSD